MQSEQVFDSIKARLLNDDNLADQYRALFTLKAIGQKGDRRAIEAICEAIQKSSSALLKHELAYVLGQINDSYALPHLNTILADESQDVMVRHEAAESLGAISNLDSLDILKKYSADQSLDVSIRETCDISIKKIEFDHRPGKDTDNDNEENQIPVIDPAPATKSSDLNAKDVKNLRDIYLNDGLPLFERYRAMFGLRNIVLNSTSSQDIHTEALNAIADGFTDKSALFRHEVAYVFGQIDSPAAIPCLLKVLYDENEHEMVRHEAAETLGGLGADSKTAKDALIDFANNQSAPKVIRDSCIVALDMLAYEQSGQFQYADGIEKA
ncbi:deoxyhypusine hydroxylase [Wallemia mellicola]|uniref:Deoxyhypusine hydroxylase n=1 Tax=Wallemia mellicola TaxID=1708541 RepID=A0AB74KE26_9BASI|nr:deoxyhypusine hydroxylase [Wallemia mellicola]